MKYVYLFLIAWLICWETAQLQDIFGFSDVWQYTVNVLVIGYFGYLLKIQLPIKKLTSMWKTRS